MSEMPTADQPDRHRRRGTQSNALSAASFIRLTAVDARVSHPVLEVLEDAGIAAYVEPSVGEVSAYRDVRPHSTPTDALYVDAARRTDAAALVAAELPGMLAELGPVTDDDEAFAAIVAGFHAPPEAEAPWPASEDADRDRPETQDEPPVAPRAAPAYAEEHFVPPPPPPLPRLRGTALWGTLALTVSFVLLLVLPLVGVESNKQLVAGILLAAGGVGTLLWGMRDAPPTDSGPDDGAVV